MPYHINITDNQRAILRLIFPGACARLRRHDPFDILEAIFFIVYTGCQWSRLPMGYPPYKTVYYHYRSWSARGYLGVAVIKADMGYRGAFRDMPLEELGIALECVKSNYGSSVFVPIGGRWVVERTFSWLQTYRRLMRNYERYLCTAGYMTLLAMIFFMLRYFA